MLISAVFGVALARGGGRMKAVLPALRLSLKAAALFFLIILAAHGQAPVNLAGPWKLSVTDNPHWAQRDVDDSAWPSVTLPQRAPRREQTYWLRRTVATLPAGENLYVTAGLVSESFELYANGSKIGESGDFGMADVHFFQPRAFRLPTFAIHPRTPLVLALRIWNQGLSWGALTNGVQDQGPYWITGPEHAAAELTAAAQGIRIALIPALVILFGQVGLALFVLILWIGERERMDLLFFAGFLVVATSSLIIGLWMAFTSQSSFWMHYAYQPSAIAAFFFLSLSAAVIMRLKHLPAWLLGAAAVLSFFMITRGGRGYYLFPWLALLAWQCFRALRIDRRGNLPFAIPLLVYVFAVGNNILPAEWRVFTSNVHAAGMTLSLTNLMQLLFSAAMLILLLRRLSADRREKQQLASEFEAARGVQQLLLSGAADTPNDYVMEAVYFPARQVGGDLYYVLPDAAGGCALVVGDVSGKGLQAALQVSLVVGALRETKERQPAGLLKALNAVTIGQTGGGFVTCCCIHFSAAGRVSIANAGHLPPYVGGREVEVTANLPLGIVAKADYEETSLTLGLGEQITLVSDGVVEAASAKRELFGFERTREISRSSASSIAAAAKAFGQNDDITVVTVRRIA